MTIHRCSIPLFLAVLLLAPTLSAREPLDPAPPISGPTTLALEWLAKHQEPDGRWDAEAFWLRSDGAATDGMGKATYTPGVTGLALLAFLRAGRSDVHEEYRDLVKKGAAYLLKLQDGRGCFGSRTSRHFLYNHSIATEVLARLCTGRITPEFKQAASKGTMFLRACQNPYRAWRYGIRPGGNDTSSTGWAVSALMAARWAKITVAPAAFEGARAWLDEVTDQETGRVGYQLRGEHTVRPESMVARFPRHRSEALTAEGIVLRIFTGADPAEDHLVKKGTALLMNTLPKWNPAGDTTDYYYWFWGTRAMRAVGSEAWVKWKTAMRRCLLESQRRDGRFRGSWDPVDPWGPDGGRVYSTALMAVVAHMVLDVP